MADYLKMNKGELENEKTALQKEYQRFCEMNLKLDMSRGKPAPAQLDVSMDMLDIKDYMGETGIDARNYGFLEGLPEARKMFAEVMGVKAEEVIVGGNASLQLMYFLVELACRTGFPESEKPWSQYEKVRFICPAPGYDRHFRITQHFGFELVTVPMTENGPDMQAVEALVANDDTVKGIWCVPKYSNPDGYTYSDETVKRLANMKTAAKDFKVFWDNAYCVHDLTDTPDELLNIMDECKKVGTQDRVIEFCSTSKITFSGAGVGAMAASEENINYFSKNLFPMTISFDKMNQLRHVKYLKNLDGIKAHMKKHSAIIKPKFDMVLNILQENLASCGDIAHWTKPNGGYFISLYAMKNTAKRIVGLCKDAGVVLTGAGAAYPYGKDPEDSNIRIAPTYPPVEELKIASELLTVCTRLATVEQLLLK
ncbi:MAG: aminotransferase class I/II-fold pyridoxal phosphate-dependent enzyme [Oscillospiraceae bacterium]